MASHLSSNKACWRPLLSVIGGCLCLSAAYAGGEEVLPMTLFPVTPGVSMYGLVGNGWTGTGDVMAPVVGRPLNFTYVDPQIYYHSGPDDYTASVGVGQRWLTDRAGILGAYVFGDYNHLNNGDSFWFVSPGVERLGEVIDMSLNGYIPVSNQRLNNGLVFADQLGNVDNVTFSGHTQYDELMQTFNSTGWGLDGEIGLHLPFRGSKLYFGGYYFAPKDNSKVGGGAVRAEVPLTQYLSAVVSEAYDSEFHNTIKGGLTLWFGGRHTGYRYNGDLATRIVDPIQRNVVATAGGAHTAQPVLSGTAAAGNTVELTNISFFVPASSTPPPGLTGTVPGSVGDGTYENPYQGMTQANVSDGNAQNNRIFYIDSGTYHAAYNPAVNPDFIELNNDLLYGRTDNFKQEASGAARPLIIFDQSGFEVPQGDTNDSFNDLQLAGSGSGAGLFINHDLSTPAGDFLAIPDVNVTVNDLAISQFGDGVDIMNGYSSDINPQPGVGNANVSINNSVITGNTGVGGALLLMSVPFTGAAGGIAGVNFGNQLIISVNETTIANNTLDIANQLAVTGGIGVVNEPSSGSLSLDVRYSSITNNTIPGCGGFCDNTMFATGGIAAINNPYFSFPPANTNNSMIINVANSEISDQRILGSFAHDVGGIAVENSGGDLTLSVSGSQISNNVVSTHSLAAGGIAVTTFNSDPLVVNIAGSTVSGNIGSSTLVSGGVAIADQKSGVATLTVTDSAVLDNSGNSGGNGQAFTNAAGGIAAINLGTSLRINVADSAVSGNTGAEADVTGGIAIGNTSGADLRSTVITVTGSSISNNKLEGITDAGGGIGLKSDSPNATTTLAVSGSTLSNNQGAGIYGYEPNGSIVVTIDKSSVFGNTDGLDMFDGGVITVTNPVYFDGKVNFTGATITFPNVTPSNGDTVVCPLLTGTCYIQP